MGRTSDAKERLLDSMMELIWLGNYSSASVDAICEHAQVKKGSFYHFFESKTDLAIAALDHGWQEHCQKMDHWFSKERAPLERLKLCFQEMRQEQDAMKIKHGRVLGCPIHSLGAEMSTVDERIRGKLESVLQKYLCYFEDTLREAMQLQQIRQYDAAELSRILFAFTEGLILHARIWNDLSQLDEVIPGAWLILGVNKDAMPNPSSVTKP
jgi:TetR/AcrR family transcriptional regulator, transcriptional repressor for nem operon